MSERKTLDVPSNRELLDGLLTIPGSTGEHYRRFYNYSPRNIGFLALQGVPPLPVATYKKWGELGFHVKKGEKAASILRPINVKVEDEKADDGYKLIRRFKVVRALFHYGQVAGEGELPPYEVPDWSVDRVHQSQDIKRLPFESFDGNLQGMSWGRNYAINPVAAFPEKTEKHELAHILHGHTTPENLADYQTHRGLKEFEAEASAHVVLKELGRMTLEAADVSRGYIQTWMRNEEPPESSMRGVLNVATILLNAGYTQSAEAEAA